MHSPLARRLAAGVIGAGLALGVCALPASAGVAAPVDEDLPSYLCDMAWVSRTRFAYGEGNCVPFNGAPARGGIDGPFHIYGRATPQERITCLSDGSANTPERVSGRVCGPNPRLQGIRTYTCDSVASRWNLAQGWGNCVPSNGAPASGHIGGRFLIQARSGSPARFICLQGGVATTPERVTGFGCAPRNVSTDSGPEADNNAAAGPVG